MKISFTGVDDTTEVADLVALSNESIFPIEYGILINLGKEGPRYPSATQRQKVLSENLFTAAHLCGASTFEYILYSGLDNSFGQELFQYDRIQVNINARKDDFTSEQVVKVFETLQDFGLKTIFQYYEKSKRLLDLVGSTDVLFDSSRGLGILAENWSDPLPGYSCGYAGGLNPTTTDQFQLFYDMNVDWIDMESGVRTDNKFDVAKAREVVNWFNNIHTK